MTETEITTDDLTEEQIERIIQSRGFQKMLGYSKLADGIDVLQQEGQVYDSMVETIRAQHSQVSSEASVREFFELFVTEVESFTEPLVSEGEADDLTGDDVEELYVGEGNDE